jgi:hypothetical protein
MKKQFKVIISIVVALALIILAISLFFPEVYKGLTSGTFGKADKYRQQQMTEKDILLRSALVADPVQLMNMINGLVYFSVFTKEMTMNIDSCINFYQTQGMGVKPQEASSLKVLRDYSDFIKNNNKTLGSTITLLAGFYLNDDSDQSTDIEKNLRDFGTYVNKLSEKDSVINRSIRSMDKFMLADKVLQTKKTELASLKSIRDQLLMQGLQLAGMLQDKPLCAQLLGYALSSQSALNTIILSQEKLGLYKQDGINAIMNQDKLGVIIGSKEVTFGSNIQLGEIIKSQQLDRVVNSNQQLGMGSVIIYDKDKLQFLVGNQSELQKVLSASQMSALLQGTPLGNLAGVAVFSSGGLNLYQSNFDLKSGFNAQMNSLGMTLSNAQLNQIIGNQQNLGGIICSSSGFVNLVGQLGSQQIVR